MTDGWLNDLVFLLVGLTLLAGRPFYVRRILPWRQRRYERAGLPVTGRISGKANAVGALIFGIVCTLIGAGSLLSRL
jgi:hypothetical protein